MKNVLESMTHCGQKIVSPWKFLPLFQLQSLSQMIIRLSEVFPFNTVSFLTALFYATTLACFV